MKASGAVVGVVAVAATSAVWGSVGHADLSVRDHDSLHTVAGVVGEQGYTIATGNFNGDAYMDLVVFNRGDEIDGERGAGSISLVWGAADGLRWDDAEVFHQNTPGVDGVAEELDWFGEAMAVGNFNGDCCDDLAVGTKREDLESNTVEQTGWVQIFSGSTAGLDFDDYSFDQETAGGWPAANETLDWFGDELAAGDYDNDGYDDLAIGVRYEDLGGGVDAVEDAGAAVVVFGGNSGLDIGEHQVILPDPRVVDGEFSYSMHAVPRPGAGDLLFVASIGPRPVGTVDVYAGLDAGQPVPEPWSYEEVLVGSAAFPLRLAGSEMVSGDFNGDGIADLVTRASNDSEVPDGDPRPNSPMFVLSGPFTADGPASIDMFFALDSDDSNILPSDPPYFLAARMVVGDFDGNGIDDVVTSVSGSTDPRGFGLVWYGAPNGLSGTNGHVVPFEGYDMAAGDFDADGYSDYVAGGFFPIGGDGGLTHMFHRDGEFTPGRLNIQLGNTWEHLGEVEVRVTRQGGSDGPASVRLITVESGTAEEGIDYLPIDEVFTWEHGESDTKTTTLRLVLDGVADRGETFELALTEIEGATSVSPTRTVGIFDGEMETVEPARLLETRVGETTIDGLFEGVGRNPAGEVMKVRVAGRGGVPEGVRAVSVNLTAVFPSAPGFATLFPCTPTVPTASMLNFEPGDVVANGALARLDDNGDLCIFTLVETDLLVDVNGFVPSGSKVAPISPVRLLETRDGETTIDGAEAGGGPQAAGTIRRVPIAGRGGIPDDAGAAFVNLTVLGAPNPGFATLYPCDDEPPNASNVNHLDPFPIANGAVTALADGDVCVFTSAQSHVLIDVVGHLPASGVSTVETTTPKRVLETRSGFETFDGEFEGEGRLAAGSVTRLVLERQFDDFYAGGLVGAFVNVTAVNPSAPGFVTLYPCTDEVPTASTLNYLPDQVVVANNAYVEVTPSIEQGLPPAAICIYTLAETDLVIDFVGGTVLT